VTARIPDDPSNGILGPRVHAAPAVPKSFGPQTLLESIILENPRKVKEILGKIHKSFGSQTLLESIIQILHLNSLFESKFLLFFTALSAHLAL
jgi:hypothetical protein